MGDGRGAVRWLWSIGAPDGRSEDLVDNYSKPDLLGEVTWRVGGEGPQRWPLFHPSEADPDGGYRPYRYAILFPLEEEPAGSYRLEVHYLVMTPRLADLEVRVNGVPGRVHFYPMPSQSGEILTMAGLHAAIYSDGVAEVVIPAALLRRGENRLELTAVDGGERIIVERIEQIKRLDRAANGAGFYYRWIRFGREEAPEPSGPVRRAVVRPTVLYRRGADGSLVERCYLDLELAGPAEATTLTLAVRDGERSEEIPLRVPAAAFGHLRIPFDLFDGDGEVAYRLSGTVGGRPFEQAGSFRRRRKWKVYITPHAHTDIGYTHRQWEVAERLCRNIDYALRMVEAEAQGDPPAFAYHLDAAWALEHYLATRSPEMTERLVKAVRERRIGVSGMYGDLLTQYAALEDLIRNSTHVDALLRPHGLSTNFATVVDVASLTGSLPAVLEGAGIRYLVHANNQDRGPFRLNGGLHRLSPFYWEGGSGGQVLVWLSRMYCELRKVCGSPPMLPSAERGLEMWLQEYESEAYAPDAVLLYGQEADNTDLDPQPVAFVKRWNETYAYPQLIACDVAEFFEYVEERFGPALKRVKGDGGAYWEDGVLSSIVPSMEVRQAQATLPAAERLEALAVVHTPDWSYPLAHFDEAWRQTLLYDEHTWGAFLSCREPDALLAQDQWAVKEGFARESGAWARRLLHAAAVRHSLNWNNDGREVVVYNPHSWAVSGTIQVEIEPDEVPVDPVTGEPVPMRPVKVLPTQMTVEVWVEGLPGLSYRRLPLQRVGAGSAAARGEGPGVAAEAAETCTGGMAEAGAGGPVALENDWYRLAVDPAGGRVVSWYDKELGRELVDGSDRWGFGQLIYARGGEGTRLMGNQANLPEGNPELLGDFRLRDCRVRRFGYGTELEVRGEVPYGELTVTWTLPEKAKWVDVRYRYVKEERREKEAVYVAFPLDLPGAEVLSDSQLGWVNWHKEQLPGGCKEWLPLQTGILVSGQGVEVLLCSPDIPLFTVGSVVRGRWPREMDLTGGRIFSYVLNNYWHTNYKASQGGEITFGYRLTSGRQIARDRAYRMGWEARRGLYGHRISFQDFRQERAPYDDVTGGTLAHIGTERVVLSTMTRARWAEGFILRLQEVSGAEQVAPVAFPGRRIARAWRTDLLERELEELPVEPDGSLRVRVPAWGLTTVRIEIAN